MPLVARSQNDLVSYEFGLKWLLGSCCRVSTLPEVKDQQELQQHSGDTRRLWVLLLAVQYYFDYGNDTSTTAEKQ